jgi:hypothetical protein
MTLQELLQKLVETEDQMERMTLVEANQELMDTTPVTTTDGEDYKAKYEELKQKYISTFFAPKGEEVPPVEETTEPTEPEESSKTIDEVLAGK